MIKNLLSKARGIDNMIFPSESDSFELWIMMRVEVIVMLVYTK